VVEIARAVAVGWTAPGHRAGARTLADGRGEVSSEFERSVKRMWRSGGSVAVVLVRFDDLPVVVERYGTSTTDQLLAAAADRIRRSIREIDLAARLPSDVFAIVVEDERPGSGADVPAAEVAERLASAFTEPLSVGNTEVSLPARVGVAVGDRTILRVEELIQRAELALADAEPGRRFRFYDVDQQHRAVRRLELKAGLSRALERNTLSLRYQPLVSLATGDLVGLESLLRWHDPDHGPVPPNEFIPLAEESDLILPIGDWVVRRSLASLGEWTATIPGLPSIGLSVNVSARQMSRPGLVATLQRTLEETGVGPEHLVLELTESAYMVDDEVMRAQLRGIRDLGVRLALDDFGTGWSSLDYLRRLPVDVVKIAQVFVDQIGTSARADALVRAIVDLAHALGLITVAEGVERAEQAEQLRQTGCFLGQGWYFARELSEQQTTAALHELARTTAPESP
jgi:diguanylate cyclase (GGDEF)-like protein